MFLKRKTSRPTRERLLADDDSHDANTSRAEHGESGAPSDLDPSDSPAAALAAKLKAKKKEREKKGRLSFGGDELEAAIGGATSLSSSPTPKKSLRASLVLKDGIVLNADSADVSNLSINDDIPAAPKYSRAYLDELRKSTARPPRPTQDAGIILDPLDDPNSMGDIYEPSLHEITRLKAKRQQLRGAAGPATAASTEEDFIGLLIARPGSLASGKDDGPHPESRLAREDDEVGDAEDELAEFTGAADRISLSSLGRKKEKGRQREDFIELVGDLEEDISDPETREWEAKQLNRGSGSVNAYSAVEKSLYTPAPLPPIQPLPALPQALQALSIRLSSLTNTHLSHTSTLSKLSEEMDDLEKKEDELRRLIQNKEKERVDMTAVYENVETIGSFLGVKFPPLIEIENRHLQLLRERCKLLIQRVLELPTSLTPPSLSEEESLALANALSNLHDRKDKIMDDVQAVEFQDPSIGVGGAFAKWRDGHPETYEAAFGSLGLIGAWEWWVRWDMCGWDIIRDPRSLDSFKWFTDLHAYSAESKTAANANEEDLAAAMVRTAVLPRVNAFLVPGKLESSAQSDADEEWATWSPFNTDEVNRVADLVEEIEAYVSSAGGGDLTNLMKGVRRAFRFSITKIGGFNPTHLISDDQRRLAKVLLDNLKRWKRVDDKGEGECLNLIRTLEGIVLLEGAALS